MDTETLEQGELFDVEDYEEYDGVQVYDYGDDISRRQFLGAVFLAGTMLKNDPNHDEGFMEHIPAERREEFLYEVSMGLKEKIDTLETRVDQLEELARRAIEEYFGSPDTEMGDKGDI